MIAFTTAKGAYLELDAEKGELKVKINGSLIKPGSKGHSIDIAYNSASILVEGVGKATVPASLFDEVRGLKEKIDTHKEKIYNQRAEGEKEPKKSQSLQEWITKEMSKIDFKY